MGRVHQGRRASTIVVRGRLKGGRAEIDGLDSQPSAALLPRPRWPMSRAKSSFGDPARNRTVRDDHGDWMKRCGIEFSSEGFERFRVRGRSRWKGLPRRPFRWTGRRCSTQSWRRRCVPAARSSCPAWTGGTARETRWSYTCCGRWGRVSTRVPKGVVARSSRLTGRVIDCNDFIDQFMLLAVVGACADGETTLTNAQSARHKECDRITEMARCAQGHGRRR